LWNKPGCGPLIRRIIDEKEEGPLRVAKSSGPSREQPNIFSLNRNTWALGFGVSNHSLCSISNKESVQNCSLLKYRGQSILRFVALCDKHSEKWGRCL
jgi:hypothetical protein